MELMQNQIPKIDAATMAPVAWPAAPELEWCPPGHGDLYAALVGSGWLERLLAEGVKYAFVSNSDNLGAILDPLILRHFADSGAPFLMEVTRRTAADRKGGHLARRKADGRLLLREVAQCPDADLAAFQDIERHPYFNTNSLWLRLDRLKEQLAADSGVLPLPMIRNHKTVDPRDPTIPRGDPIGNRHGRGHRVLCGFRGHRGAAQPLRAGQNHGRFASLAFGCLRGPGERPGPAARRRVTASRPSSTCPRPTSWSIRSTSLGVPSLIGCRSLSVSGPVRFAPGVVLQGDVEVTNAGAETKVLAPGIIAISPSNSEATGQNRPHGSTKSIFFRSGTCHSRGLPLMPTPPWPALVPLPFQQTVLKP